MKKALLSHGLSGDVTGLYGDATGLYGNATGLSGDVDHCDLNDAERDNGVNIGYLVAQSAAGDGELIEVM